MRISYSALETFAQCPQKYKFQEIDKIRVPKSKEAIFGTSIHNALKFMFSRDPLFPTIEEVLAHFRETFLASESVPEEDKKRYSEAGEKMIRNFYAKNPPWNFVTVDLESHFEVTLTDPFYKKTHTLAGSIDRIDKLENGSYEIIDYKTSRKLPAQEQVDSNSQLAIYQLALQKRWPEVTPDKIKLALYFLKSGDKFITRRSSEDIAKTEEKILSRIHTIEIKIEEKDFPPIPSILCDWCGYKPMCPAWRHLYKKTEVPHEEQAIEKTVDEYIALKKELDEREKRLDELASAIKAYFDEHALDRVFGSVGSVMRSAQERKSWDAAKVEELLKNNPIWQELLAIDTKKIPKLLPRLPYNMQEQLKNEALIIKKFTVLKSSTTARA